ncbi:hypothetical protein L1887_02796 [Cichorium endivia]|nr:hypothetical protein L1887_02796 [Cichorium endivia]
MNENTEYIGGLIIYLSFDCSVDATLLGCESRWKEWFKWMIRGDQQELRYERTAWLNILVTIMADGASFTVGVVEYTDDWSPFHPCPFDKVEEDSDDEDGGENDKDGDDDTAILDTWMLDEDNEVEEGEIRSKQTSPLKIRITGDG